MFPTLLLIFLKLYAQHGLELKTETKSGMLYRRSQPGAPPGTLTARDSVVNKTDTNLCLLMKAMIRELH